MSAAFTSGLAGAAALPASAFRQRIGRMIEAAKAEAARIQEEQHQRPLDGGGYSKPDTEELARAAVFADIAVLLNELVAHDGEIAALVAGWARVTQPRSGG